MLFRRMMGKQIWTFEKLELLKEGIEMYGCNWSLLQQKLFPKFKPSQIRNVYYKLRRTEPEAIVAKPVPQNRKNDLFDIELL